MNPFLKFIPFLLLLIVFSAACNHDTDIGKKHYNKQAIDQESKKANLFFERSFDNELRRDPERMTWMGMKERNDEWTDRSDSFARHVHSLIENELQNLRDSIDYDKLDEATQISYMYFEYRLQLQLDNFRWRFHNYPLNQLNGIQSDLPAFLISKHRIDSKNDADAYISRLRKIPQVFRQVADGVHIRDSLGINPPAFVFPMLISDCRNIIRGQPFDNRAEKSPLLDDFISKISNVKSIPEKEKKNLIEQASRTLRDSVLRAYQSLISLLDDVGKKAGTDDGCWKFPDGDAFYQYQVRAISTLEINPDDLFEKGKAEVRRIHNEMLNILIETHWRNDNLHEFFDFVRKDSAFYFRNNAEGRKAYKNLETAFIDSMKLKLGLLFHVKPTAKLELKAVEPFREQSAAQAFYESPAADGSRPGTYYMNLSDMHDLPKYQAEAIAYHEGIPGRHMQVAVAQELAGLPSFRKNDGNLTYAEGWALYAELIPKECGMYKNPYSDFGRLANELFYSAKLVVDIGIHSRKWSRSQAIEYLIKNTPNTNEDCRKQVDRMIVWPANAISAKTGMMQILELRELARKELGDKFDLREFHDVLLSGGSLPLDMLADAVRTWIACRKLDKETVTSLR